MNDSHEKRILVSPDKFKGSLTAPEAAVAIALGIRDAFGKRVKISICPIADGGEGTAEILCREFDGEMRKTMASDPLGRLISAGYCRSKTREGIVAVLEMSEASGMKRLNRNELNPLCANTLGTGQLIAEAIKAGAGKIIVGLGGSATTDGGIGMAAALGYRFLDAGGKEIEPMPANLGKLQRIEAPNIDFPEILAAVDVENVLFGPEGAAVVFGPQKGADEDQVKLLDANLKHLAKMVQQDLGFNGSNQKGAGAAGGLGFGLAAFCGAKIVSGFDLVADVLNLRTEIQSSDLVITGEGKADAQTLHGKGPAKLAEMAKKMGKPVMLFAGSVTDENRLREVFDEVVSISDGSNPEAAMENAAEFLRAAVSRTIAGFPIG